ncbi:uncharacterized protein LOC104890473 [Beta vulgaris subsp. vulgaris]|uniref:uncharacterized protein LOC104890473 n=1 Tax=Beta vulgaris subsp. vulgaris TaxID=3555 RepID=UPI00254694FA|nr:uncharacterized protein LOC104890473 [Beta vulgaris subsp. vulgaris]
MYRFTKHLSIFRTQIRRWCLDHKVVWGIDWQELSTKLMANATGISSLPQGNAFMHQRQQELDKSALAHSYWSQRSKDKFVQIGDLPTKFFYNKMRQKQRATYIYLLRIADDQWTEDGPTIVNTILHHFKDAYGPSQVPLASAQVQDEAIDLVLRDLNLPHLSPSQQQQLIRPFSKDEVHEAMFGIGQGKSPGMDGSTAEFFKHHWVALGNEVFQAVNHFFTTGFILHEWNQTLIVLLPKGQNPEDVTQFRPISLCNTIYKCVSKCLVNRLRPLLSNLITEFQSAFIPGRHMDDNILISHELTHVLNKHRNGNVHLAALKIDMNKAYDRVNWRFLLKVLQAYGFPAQWIQLISQCISTVKYRILVNGQVTESFPSHCGLRQGDPLSPYLFLFCMDIFSRMMIMATDIRLFDGIRAHSVDYFLYETVQSTWPFCHISGQMLSVRKSFVKFSPNVSEAMGQEYKSILQLNANVSLGTYLGTPVDIQGKKTQHFTFLLDKISQRITAWNYSPISQAGKLILINSVLIASIAHILSVFLIPTTITNKLDAMLARFFWSNCSGKGIAWKSKELLHLQKGAGGLGLRSIALHNRSLLLKKVWRIHRDSNGLISKVFANQTLHPGSSIATLRPMRSQCSWGARGLLQAEKVLLTNYNWKIGSKSRLRACNERWVHGRIPLFRDNVSLHTAATVSIASLLLPHQQGWNVSRLHSLFHSSTVRDIRALEVPRLTNQEDLSIWPFTTSGQYTTKSGYYFLSRNTDIYSMNSPLNSEFFRILWGLRIMPKWKLFLWKLYHNGLATTANLSYRGLASSDGCPNCNLEPETCQHLFRFCHLSTLAWQTSQLSINSNVTPLVSFKDWLIAWIHYFYQQDGYNGHRLPLFVAILWAIWQGRNQKVFNGTIPDLPLIRSLQDKGIQQHLTFLATPTPQLKILHEAPGPPGFLFAHFGLTFSGVPQLQIQVDGSWKKSSPLAGIAWVVDNVSNNAREGQGSCIYAESGLVAEARACLGALLWAQARGYYQILIYTDSEILVRSLIHQATQPISIAWTLNDIRILGQQLRWCRIIKANRQQVQRGMNWPIMFA